MGGIPSVTTTVGVVDDEAIDPAAADSRGASSPPLASEGSTGSSGMCQSITFVTMKGQWEREVTDDHQFLGLGILNYQLFNQQKTFWKMVVKELIPSVFPLTPSGGKKETFCSTFLGCDYYLAILPNRTPRQLQSVHGGYGDR